MKYRFLLVFFLYILCATAYADQPLRPGFKTLGVWEPGRARLDLAIWYPTTRSPFKLDYGDWIFSAARGATPVPGKHPLILLSHDSPGSRFSLHALASKLASSGFVVAALTHARDNLNDMSILYTGTQLISRAEQLHTALDVLLEDKETAPLIDPQRIGAIGVGPGGTAVLMLAGGVPDPHGWTNYCSTSSAEDIYCHPWVEPRIDALVKSLSLKESLRDSRIRAAAAVAPAYGMLLTRNALSQIRIPILLVGAGKTPLSPPHLTESVREALPAAPSYTFIPDASTITLTSPCGNGTLSQTLPELCRPVPERETVQAELAQSVTTFFLAHLGDSPRSSASEK